MNAPRIAALTALAALHGSAGAHALDEYLQATIIAVTTDRARVTLRMVPGIAIVPALLGIIDTDSNGTLSKAEQLAYANRVRADVSLHIDAEPLRSELRAAEFPSVASMREGLGEIRLELGVKIPAGGPRRRLVFENRHLRTISVYLVNSLAPSGADDISMTAQRRSPDQSRYELDYAP
jgi:hypothetical protein